MYRRRRKPDGRDLKEKNASWLQAQVHQPVSYRTMAYLEK
jgi:hypothetical protein